MERILTLTINGHTLANFIAQLSCVEVQDPKVDQTSYKSLGFYVQQI